MFFTGFLKVAGEDAYGWTKAYVRSLLKLSPKAPQSGGAMPLSGLAYADIHSELERTTPLLRSEVAARYVGQRVRWSAELVGANKDGNVVYLHFEVEGMAGQMISCSVRSGDYPQLPFLPRRAPVLVTGEIQAVKPLTTVLTNVQLEFPKNNEGADPVCR